MENVRGKMADVLGAQMSVLNYKTHLPSYIFHIT